MLNPSKSFFLGFFSYRHRQRNAKEKKTSISKIVFFTPFSISFYVKKFKERFLNMEQFDFLNLLQ